MTEAATSFVTIGRVTAPHGVAGEVRVLPMTDFPERFDGLTRVYLDVFSVHGGTHAVPAVRADSPPTRRTGLRTPSEAPGKPQPVRVERLRWHKQFVLMKFDGVDRRDDAAALRGAYVQVPLDEAHPLPPDTHYVFQLIGMEVYTRQGRRLGVVRDVLATGANDVYVIERAGGGPDLLVPAVRHVVVDIDDERRRIEVELLPGLE